MMNLAASRNWLDCTIKLIYLCQMLIQGQLLSDSNLLILPNSNKDKINSLQDKLAYILTGSALSIPSLRAQMYKKDNNQRIKQIFESVFGEKNGTQALKVLSDLPMLTIKTLFKNIDNNQIVSLNIDKKSRFIDLQVNDNGKYIFQLDIHRDGSSKMNVYSKKFNKQKEEFWFLIFVEEETFSFRKFSFARHSKRIEIPVQFPAKLGKF